MWEGARPVGFRPRTPQELDTQEWVSGDEREGMDINRKRAAFISELR